MKIHIAKCALAALAGFAAMTLASASDNIPLDYYSSLQGLSGSKLKTAIHNLVTQDVSMLTYGKGKDRTWWGFYVTDRDPATNAVIDRYSNNTRYFSAQGDAIGGMNIEHSFPKSWWGKIENNAYKDLFNLMPSEQTINSSKSNYPMGKVTNASTDNGCTKVGRGPQGYMLWEPADKWKGDFARGYMYMATAYQDFTWSGTQALQILEQGSYPTLQKWAYELYIEWARADKVTQSEFERNGKVQSFQGNRNPFVDFPNLMEYVWGDSTEYALDIRTTVKAGNFSGTVIDPSETPVNVYECTFLGNEGDCTIDYAMRPSAINRDVWVNDAQYGWKASAATGSTKYDNLVCHEADATLLTPEIDLTSYGIVTASFDHACNFAADPSAVLSVGVRTEGNETTQPVTVGKWPSGKNWTFVPSGKIDLSKYAGQKIRLAFRYTSNSQEASTWEVKNLVVTAYGRNSGIDRIPPRLQPDCDNSAYPVEYYTLDGRRIDPATYRGIVIRRQGTAVSKVVIR